MTPYPRQQGVALITVLLVTAVATVIASEVVSRLHFHIQRNQAQQAQAQAYQYALGGEALVRQLLHQDYQENEFDQRTDRWAKLKPVYKFDQGQLTIQVVDLNSRLNINNLLSQDGQINDTSLEQFKRLFATLNIDQQRLDALLDWLDRDSLPKGLGSEDDEYLAMDKPYRSANQALSHLSELTLLKGWDNQLLRLLAPHITVLPTTSDININTASAEVLTTLAKELDLQKAEALVTSRESNGFDSMDSFISHGELAGIKVNSQLASVSSNYFLAYVESRFAGSRIRLQSILYRDPSTGELSLVSRDRNSRFLWPRPIDNPPSGK
ncbi:General secretion pathway protein K [gamma proteobacterium IMCC2047]|nr:General secretion pathway protein K [gamma proteobacterium IMCC2047]